jgi:hypothetical protein
MQDTCFHRLLSKRRRDLAARQKFGSTDPAPDFLQSSPTCLFFKSDHKAPGVKFAHDILEAHSPSIVMLTDKSLASRDLQRVNF